MACIERAVAGIGLVVLLAGAATAQIREPKPIQGPTPLLARLERPSEQERASNLAAVNDGIATALGQARGYFETGRRGEAVKALDAAHRVAKVVVHAASAETYPWSEAVEFLIGKSRVALQNGRPEEALTMLGRAEEAVAMVPEGPDRRPRGPRVYRGAILLSVEGQKLGEIETLDKERGTAAIGPWLNTLGFIDLDGVRVGIATEDLVFGPNEAIGLSLVVLADPTVKTVEDLQQRGK